jgi:hypothetical protein
MGKRRAETVIAERLPDLGTWELYVLKGVESGDTVCKVALRPGTPDGVEYGVFRGEDGEPSAAGALGPRGSWSDEAREDALKELLTIYRSKLPALRGGVMFDFYCEREEEDEDELKVDDDEDDEEDDNGKG